MRGKLGFLSKQAYNYFYFQLLVFLMRAKTLAIMGCLLALSSFALAQQSGGDFEITESTIDNGGGTSSGGEFSLTGTIGQPDANPQISAGGQFVLSGGFWASATSVIFSDGFESDG